jgi:hypothetical protein
MQTGEDLEEEEVLVVMAAVVLLQAVATTPPLDAATPLLLDATASAVAADVVQIRMMFPSARSASSATTPLQNVGIALMSPMYLNKVRPLYIKLLQRRHKLVHGHGSD